LMSRFVSFLVFCAVSRPSLLLFPSLTF
jgi:hypothetical protein